MPAFVAACRGCVCFAALLIGLAPALAQSASSHPWLDPTLLAAAKAEGSLTVYSSTNEQEGLPLFKIFEDATGIKFDYIRGNDASLLSRVAIETRAGQPSFDIIHISNAHKMPPQMLAQVDLSEAKAIFPQARDPNRRWYGVYTVYNTPAYNTEKVKASDLPKSFEELAERKEWAGKVALEGTDIEWLKGMLQYYGEQKGTALVRAIVANLKPVLTDGRLAMARSVGAGEYLLALNNFANLSLNVKLAGGPIEIFPLDPVALFYAQVAVNAQAPASERGAAGGEFHAQSGMPGFLYQVRPAADARRRADQSARHRRAGHAEASGRHAVRSAGRSAVATDLQYALPAALIGKQARRRRQCARFVNPAAWSMLPASRSRGRSRNHNATPREGLLTIACRFGAAGLFGLALASASRRPSGRAGPIPGSTRAARRRQGGRVADHLLLDQRAGRPAAVQDFRGCDRHQGAIRARRRQPADVAHGDRVPRRAEGLGHPPDHDDQQDAAADDGADRSARGEEPHAGGARSRPALVWRSTPTTIRRPTTPSW